jgi:hypothetical protein
MHGPALPESVTHGHVCADLRFLTPEIIDGPDAPRGPSAPSLAGGSLQRIEDSSEQLSMNSELQTVITPLTGWELHLQSGEGLRRNDARAAMALDEAAATPRVWGAEVGTRLSLLDQRLELAAAFWFVHLESDSVRAADEGAPEPSEFTDPYGLDFEIRFRILPWMWADGTLTLAQDGSAVPLAPTFIGQAGLSVLHPAGWRGRLGARWVGSRPATSDPNDPRLQAQGYFLLDLTVAYRWRFLEVGLAVEEAPDPINVRGALALYF